MKSIFFSALIFAAISSFVSCTTTSKKTAADTRCFEMRTYYAPPGKLDDLHARYRNHTLKFFKKHGMENLGFWVPKDNSENKIVYLLAYPSRAAREESWTKFVADPEWNAIVQNSEANGKLVGKIEQVFLEATDFSPAIKTGNISHGGVFELRTYTTPPGSLLNLDARFRDHTLKLFKKHGMNNWAYFHKTSDQPDSTKTLIYFLTHKSQDAAKASFDAFRKDPDWIAARDASEKSGGGSLTVKDGVKSVFLVPTDYSPTK